MHDNSIFLGVKLTIAIIYSMYIYVYIYIYICIYNV